MEGSASGVSGLGGAMAAAMGGEGRVSQLVGLLPSQVGLPQPSAPPPQPQASPVKHAPSLVSLNNVGVPTIQVEKPYGCGDCGKHFKRKDHLNRHRQRSYHNSEPPPPIKSIPNPAFLQGQQAFQVQIRRPAAQAQQVQQAPAVSHPQSMQHQQHQSAPAHVHQEFKSEFKSVAAMDALPANRFPCPEQGCTKSFKSSYHLRRHHAVHTSQRAGGLPPVPPPPPARASNLPTQVVVSAPPAPPQPIIIQQPSQPQAHQPAPSRRSNPNKVKVKYECSICGTKLSRAEHLLRHQRRLHPDKVNQDDPKLAHYACQICGKQCFDSHKLKVHMNNAHLEEQPFECPTCHRKFKTAVLLRRHKKATHLAEKAAAAAAKGGHRQTAQTSATKATTAGLQAFQVPGGQLQIQGQAGQYFMPAGQGTPIIIQVQNPATGQQQTFRQAQGQTIAVARPSNVAANTTVGTWPTAYAWPVQTANAGPNTSQAGSNAQATTSSQAQDAAGTNWPWAGSQWASSAQPQSSKP